MKQTSYPVPSIEELRNTYSLGAIDLQTTIKARWMSGSDQHAPNGTDELLAWILILIDMVGRKEAAIEEQHDELRAARIEIKFYREYLQEIVDLPWKNSDVTIRDVTTAATIAKDALEHAAEWVERRLIYPEREIAD